MLCDLMASTGILGKPQSFFRPESISEWAKQLGVEGHAIGSTEFERAYLAAIRNQGADASGTFGLRLMWDSVHGLIQRLRKVFPDDGDAAALFENAFGLPLYVSLIREDKVAQAVSLVRAKQSGQWHLASDGSVRQGVKTPQPTTYDAEAIKKEMMALAKDDAAWQTWFEQQNLTPLQVSYEDLAEAPRTVLATLLDAIGGDPAIAKSLKPGTSRMADGESRQWVARYRKESR